MQSQFYHHGVFVRSYWYERGIEHGNPDFNTRFRVNAAEASLQPDIMYRDEARGNGMLQILIEEDLAQLENAYLYCELWGGHPETEHKRVSVNGRSTYTIPEVGTEAGHCTHQYPTLPLKLTDLVNGYNVFQFACDQGQSFWGHFIVDNACLHIELKHEHPDLETAGLSQFQALVGAVPVAPEMLRLSLLCAEEALISHVHYIGYYKGYDENGNAHARDWHGFTKNRTPVAILGTVTEPPFTLDWDVSLIPDQKSMAVQAMIYFKSTPTIHYRAAALSELATPTRAATVSLYPAQGMGAPFWSRDGQVRRCHIPLDVDPATIERAQLHVVVWDGGKGTVTAPFTFNRQPLPVVGDENHDVLYRVLDIDPGLLKRGDNGITVLSDTEHHGIEVLLPGPALVVRHKA